MKTSIRLLPLILVVIITASCNPPDQNIQQKALILKGNDEILNKGNLDYADELFRKDYRSRGPEIIKEFAAELRTAFPDLSVTVDPLITENDLTAWKRTNTGTHTGELMGFKPTGKRLVWEDYVITRYEKGKVAEEWGISGLEEKLRKEDSPSHNAEALTSIAHGVVNALNTKNAKGYLANLHPDVTFFLVQNPELVKGNNLEAMEEAFENGMNFNMRLEELEIAFYGNTAIITGFEYGPAQMADGRVIDGKRKYSSVWIYEGGKWKEVHLHISRAE